MALERYANWPQTIKRTDLKEEHRLELPPGDQENGLKKLIAKHQTVLALTTRDVYQSDLLRPWGKTASVTALLVLDTASVHRWDAQDACIKFICEETVAYVGPGPLKLTEARRPTGGSENWSFAAGRFVAFYSIEALADKIKPEVPLDTKRLVLPDSILEQINQAISFKETQSKVFDDWGFSDTVEKGRAVAMLFYGGPGTGKTLAAQVIARQLKLKLQIIQSADVQSSQPGQTERNIRKWFQDAREKNLLLLFDECDSLITDRNHVGMIIAAEINALLSALEQHDGVVIFTTNRVGSLDEAMERRLSAKIEFPFPDEKARAKIWRTLTPLKAPLAKDVSFDSLARAPLAGGNIKNCILSAARRAAYLKAKEIALEHFLYAIEKEIEGKQSFDTATQDYFSQQAKVRLARGFDESRANGDIEVVREVATEPDESTSSN